MHDRFDVIVIGAGPGGYVAAIKAAKKGLKTAVVENRRVGGTCLNRGCIPTKAMIHAAEAYRNALAGSRFGIHASDVSFDYGEIISYREETIDTLVGGIEKLMGACGITILNGTGTLCQPQEGRNMVRVASEDGTEDYGAEHVLLAAGSGPARLPVPGIDLPGVLNSDGLFALDHAPERLVIIGGGVIGVEFAEVFSSLGTEVTIIEALPKILDNFDKEISQNLKMILKKRGVDIHTGAMVQKITAGEDGQLTCEFTEKDKPKTASGDTILCAAGRTPQIEGLLDEGVSLEMNGRFIKVDENFCTSMKNVYAIGDLIGGIQLAHAASAHALWLIGRLTGEDGEELQDLSVIPGCVYTDPEIASAGMTEVKAKEEGIDVSCGKFIMSANGKSLITKEERGFIKVVADTQTGCILGAQMMCARATDMIGEFTTAIVNGMTVSDMLRGVRAHPTYNEGIGEALEAVFGESLHTVSKRR